MRTMATLLAAFCAFASVWANLWTGTIIETVTSTTDPRLNVGDVFTGTYSYMSETGDGLASNNYWVSELTGIVEAMWINSPSFDHPLNSGTGTTFMEVQNGLVTDFFYSDQMGGLGCTFAFSDFSFRSDPTGNWGILGADNTQGTLIFSRPVDPPRWANIVSDGGATAAMLGGALLGLAALRRRFATQALL